MNEHEWSVWVKLYINFMLLVIYRKLQSSNENQNDLYSRQIFFLEFLQNMLIYIDINNKTGMYHIHITHY